MEGRRPTRPRVLVSACLCRVPCRYDGRMIRSAIVGRLKTRCDIVPVCPEVGIGLGVPRDPIRIVGRPGRLRLMQTKTGRDLTSVMRRHIRGLLRSVGAVDGFILKARSPSCGIGDAKVFPSLGARSARGRADGFLAREIVKTLRLPAETEKRLSDRGTREAFLSRLFAAASRRQCGR